MWKKSSAVCYFDLGATREQIIRKLKISFYKIMLKYYAKQED